MQPRKSYHLLLGEMQTWPMPPEGLRELFSLRRLPDEHVVVSASREARGDWEITAAFL